MDVPYHDQPQLHVEARHRAALLTYPGNLNKALEEAQADASKTMFGVAHGIPSVYLTKVSYIVTTSGPIPKLNCATPDSCLNEAGLYLDRCRAWPV